MIRALANSGESLEPSIWATKNTRNAVLQIYPLPPGLSEIKSRCLSAEYTKTSKSKIKRIIDLKNFFVANVEQK
jgi:hypothetical protein